MSNFIQIHMLTSYPPSNLNRDDLGRPKTATMGGVTRLRISSQSLKRAWRTAWKKSDEFKDAIGNQIGERSKRFVKEYVYGTFEKHDSMSEDERKNWCNHIQQAFGEPEGKDKDKPESLKELTNKELLLLSPKEITIIKDLARQLAEFYKEKKSSETVMALLKLYDQWDKDKKKKKEKAEKLWKAIREFVMGGHDTSVDQALFGRMLARVPKYNIEAAAQVAHAITVHRVDVEDDFFTAVDDLNKGEEDKGAGHIGETEFGAGVFYKYICINKTLLLENLGNDEQLASKTLGALLEAAATVAPNGKQNSFASRARASFILCEKGSQQPRSLSVAFLKPVSGDDFIAAAIAKMSQTVENMDKAYGQCCDKRMVFDTTNGSGNFNELKNFATE